jgi:hypothetical protein
MNFDKTKFLKLLKERKSLKQQGKLLKDYDRAKNEELNQYFILLENQIFWGSREEYVQILNSFVRKNINLNEFFTQFYTLRGSNLRFARLQEENFENESCEILNLSNKIDFQLNPESVGFERIISILHSWAELCDDSIPLEMQIKDPQSIFYGISEEFFRFIIEGYFLPELKKYCKKS